MANKTKYLTVTDLEEAKERCERMANINAPYNELFDIAATCIGIVEEMVKLNRNIHNGLCEWTIDGGWRDKDGVITEELAQINTADFGCVSNIKEGMMFKSDCDHIVALHNLWLKAVKAYKESEEK